MGRRKVFKVSLQTAKHRGLDVKNIVDGAKPHITEAWHIIATWASYGCEAVLA